MLTGLRGFVRIFLFIFIVGFSWGVFSQTTYKVLFDNSKSQTAGNADWKIDDDEPYPNPASPTAESDWIGGISSWGYELWVTGNYQIVQLPAGSTITYGDTTNPLDLSNFDVFVSVEPNNAFSDAEKEAIISFVENGGGLFIVADHTGSDRDGDGIDSPRVWNDLFNNNPRGISNIFGVTFNLNSISGSYTAVRTSLTEPEDDALFNGPFGNVTGIAYHSGASMTIDTNANSNVRGQIWIDTNYSDSDVVVATSRFGSGRIAIIGDSSPCDDGTGAPGDTLYDGWNESGVTDREIFLNLTQWLAEGGGTSSGIYIGTPQLTPATPANGDSVTVDVEITDDGSITSAVLMWKTFKDDVYNSLTMTNTAGDNYQAIIPAQSDTIVQYKIVATDNDGNTASAGIYSYQVGYIPICDLRDNANDSDGVNKYNNLNVVVKGIVTAPTVNCFGSAGKTDIYIQDSSGCGINIYNGTSDQPEVLLGDVVEVKGKLTQYNGKLEIDISSGYMNVIGTDTVPAPTVITCSQFGEDFEGKLIRINGVHVVSGTIPASGSSGSFVIEDSTGQITVFIDKDGEIDGMETPTGDFDLIGIAGQYDSSSPYTDGYQIQPRFQSDFVTSGTASVKELYFSEYIEGSSYNKALEIFNETGSAVDLSEYSIELYVNGATTAGSIISLSGTLNDGETFVICHTSASQTLLDLANMTSGSLTFNGDDAIVLKHNGEVVDSIGRVGEDPGSYWGDSTISTSDMTLRRKPHIHQGDTVIDDEFIPSVEWDAYPQDDFSDVGKHTCLYTLHVEVSEGQGTTNPSGDVDYQYKTSVEISATPSTGYYFDRWTGYVETTDNPVQVVMDKDITLYAHFLQNSGVSDKELYFSEYVEGSGNNKAVEIYNETGSDIDLSEYTVEIYNNGATTPNYTIGLSGTLVDGNAYVIVYSGADASLTDLADMTTSKLSFNGDDAIVLKHNGKVVDSIGRVGEDPGSYWGDSTVSTRDMTLRRKPHIHQGDTVIDDEFIPATEWDAYPQDDFSDLGSHICLYYVTVSVSSGSGTVSPSGTSEHQYKSSVEITATPDSGFIFDSWEGYVSSTDNPLTVTIRQDISLSAVFVEDTSAPDKELYFSEYVEGSGYNKAVEIYNETGSDIDLSEYTVEIYNNGATTPNYTIGLSGTLVDGNAYVIVYSGADTSLTDLADMTTSKLSFNGDDAIVLKHNGKVVDSIGRVGEDPGSYWGDSTVSTRDMTLRRKPHIHQGDTVIDDEFIPATEWDAYPQDDFSDLGSHTCLYYVTVSVSSGSGTVSPSGTSEYQYKSSVEITASPDTGNYFSGWSGDVVSIDNPLTIVVDKDYTVSALFAELGYNGKNLYFSEYIEGSGYNKAIEIFNETGSNIDLSAYTIEIYNNGSNTPNHTIALSGTLNDGETFVIVADGADTEFTDRADLITVELSFNGDDAIVLKNNGEIIDAFGEIGYDPGSAWSGNGIYTRDMTLVRKPDIHQGDTNAYDSFDPSVEWEGYPQDTYEYLGSHSCLYSVTVTVVSGNGTVNPSGTNSYQYNTVITVEATPGENNYFAGWSGDVISSDNPLSITVNRDYTLNASFQELGFNGKNLYFSEYLEGAADNKAIEIYNETGVPVDLSYYSIEIYNNGSSTPNHTISLSGILNDGETFVIVYNRADTSLLNLADLVTAELSFNGDDAIVLKNRGAIIDSIGEIGYDPGSAWSGNGVYTRDMDLRRKQTLHKGDSNAYDSFDPSVEWEGYDLNDFSNFGNYHSLYVLNVSVGDGVGTVEPSGITFVPYNATVTVSATPALGYRFSGWVGDFVSNVTSLSFTMLSDINLTANFYAVYHTITATAGENGQITPSGVLQVLEGSDYAFSFIPDEGYKVKTVLVDGAPVSSSSIYVFRNVMEDHSISVTFEKALPPVITSFTVEPGAGNAPFTFTAKVSANDPDGGNIIKYVWDITGKRSYQFVTTSPMLTHTLILAGDYSVRVSAIDDEGESVSSNWFGIKVSPSAPVVIPVPSSDKFSEYKANTSVKTQIVNIFNESVALTAEGYDASGKMQESVSFTVPALGSVSIDENVFSKNFDYLVVKANKYVLAFSEIEGDSYHSASYLRTELRGQLFVSHIAEEVEDWDSIAYISNPGNFDLIVNSGGEEYSLSSDTNVFVDLESILPVEPQTGMSWAKISAFTNNPFEDTRILTGFELFVKNGKDGAAVEINTMPSNTLFIPHIPEEADLFWTGLTLVNTEKVEGNVEFVFYSANGEITGTYSLKIAPESKYKTLLRDILPQSSSASCWATITSDVALTGIELFGTYQGAICGYSLVSSPKTEGVVPGLKSGDFWNGISVVNPNGEETSINFKLYGKDGNLKAESSVSVAGFARYKALVSDLFENVTLEEGDTIRFFTSKPVVIIKISGDSQGRVMDALSFAN